MLKIILSNLFNGTINYIKEFNPINKQKIKTTFYHLNGQNIDYIEEYNDNGEIINNILATSTAQ
ncbi:DUF2963 domain-containing protein [Candidatus Phytoplasma sp. AldY-WA1]|uniref:DUF2963 domain-containing protein n=1 Tax=Candidatus Phytoplasma sp. AldY-WA1 TaxID=2852100 RepID=UPI00403DD557